MAQAGGSATIFAVGMLLFSVLQCALTVEGATYVVGDGQGWNSKIQSSGWSIGKNFKAGDILVFNYNPAEHDLVVVSANNYRSCTTGGSRTLSSGSDRITLHKGVNYFICGFPGHCSAGMKLAVTAA